MSRRDRVGAKRARRQRVAPAKQLRRRARIARARSTALTSLAAVTVACTGPAGETDTRGDGDTATSAASAVTGQGCGAPTASSRPHDIVAVGDGVFFGADGGEGQALWRYDGAAEGTALVADVKIRSGGGYRPYAPVAVGGSLFFTTSDAGHGLEVWQSDGTGTGTAMVKDLGREGGNAYAYGPADLTAVGSRLFFTDDDGRHGLELWETDGTAAGTVMVKDIEPGSKGYDYEYHHGPKELTAVGGTLFFTADDGRHGQELWKTDGTEAGTAMVKDLSPGGYDIYGPEQLTRVGDHLLFDGGGLWISDGSATGTRKIFGQPNFTILGAVEDNLFFTAGDKAHGRELWVSDGTAEGTQMLEDIRPGKAGSSPSLQGAAGDAATARGKLFFTADDGVHGRELWATDGTEAGTLLVKDIVAGEVGTLRYDRYRPMVLTSAGEQVFFTADDGLHGRELWVSDGTSTGTVLVKDIVEGPSDSLRARSYEPFDMAAAEGLLFFTADDSVHGAELWVSDGTEAGTFLVTDLNVSEAPVTEHAQDPETCG